MKNSILRPFTIKTCACLFVLATVMLSCNNESVDAAAPPAVTDSDNDGIPDGEDNCPNVANPNQEDQNNDGLGDACDTNMPVDTDNDGVPDAEDNCPNVANPNQEDDNNDGIGNACEDAPNTNPLFPCENGMAGPYPCNGYDLMGHIPNSVLGNPSSEGNDSWGWTDSATGNEYALVGTTQGTAFVDITDPVNPLLLGRLASASPGDRGNVWRDVKVYNNHAFIVSEANGHGMQVFDLTRLRNVANPPATFAPDAHYRGFGSAHNIVINEDSGYAYIVGTSRSGTYAGGPLFLNIQNPLNPVNEGGFFGYSHDAQVLNYNGPDADYAGQEILIGSNENEVVIVNVTNKANPQIISRIAYDNIGYTHQGWFTEDLAFFILGDELDEQNFGSNTRTIVFNFTDLDNPSYHMDYSGPTAAIDHNGYVKGNTFYIANYAAGLRMVDISNIAAGSMWETGYFDTYPPSNNTTFRGAWNVYPYFESGNIIISDINGGLFIVKKQN
ncbi:choice-of-anchor B family protein [Bizionia sediminis]|uniref:Choice-of-anchor B family protein n=1 Tax=Bizionia sediminis TaxID=1737064 RepID=A0ABW5KU72_9FLAO